MADYVAAKITIGGRLNEPDVETLANALASDAVSLDYGEGGFTVQEAADALRAGNATFMDDQARYGRFEEIEAACISLGLAFKVQFDAGPDWSAGCQIRALDGTVSDFTEDGDGEPCFTANELTKFSDLNTAIAALQAVRDWAVPLEIVA